MRFDRRLRIAAGLAAVFGLFGLAALWQTLLLEDLRREQAEREGSGGGAGTAIDRTGWARIVVGAPSGAEPVPLHRAPVQLPIPPKDLDLPGTRDDP